MDGSDEWDGTRWHGLYVDDIWMVHKQLDLYAGLRYEDYAGDRTVDIVQGYQNGRPAGFGTTSVDFDEEALLPKFGAIYRPVEGLALEGRFARSTRFPDNPAFYWYYGGYRPEVDPNSDVVRGDLTYEDALQYEIGADYTALPGWRFALSYYHYDVDDYLRWIFGYAPSRVVYNIDNVTFDGVEAEAEGQVWENVFAFANATWQTTKKEGDVLDGSNALTDELSELPEWKFNFGVKYERPDGALARLTVRWVDERQVPFLGEPGAPFAGDSAPEGTPTGRDVTLITLDDFVTVDVLFQYPVWKGETGSAKLTAGVDNLFDEDYREEYDFPAPGQVFHVGAEVTF
jgi:iron complex outermembrane receptor protein